MRLLLAVTCLLAVGCSPAPAPAPSPAASAAATTPAPTAQPTTPAPAASPVVAEGWVTDPTQAPIIGQTAGAPEFADLVGVWTIVFLASPNDPAATADQPYYQALVSASRQDPDLAAAIVDLGRPLGASVFGDLEPPHYMLLDPGLVVRGVRGKFAGTQEDGIKGAVKGVAEIKKALRQQP